MANRFNGIVSKLLLLLSMIAPCEAQAADAENQHSEHTVSFAFDELPPIPRPKESRLKRTWSRIMEKRHDKPRGNDDPNTPVNMMIKPTMIKLPKTYTLPKSLRVVDGKLDLNSITPTVIRTLSEQDLKCLLELLSRSKVKIKWWNKDDDPMSGKNHHHPRLHRHHWDISNAAAAIAMELALHSEIELATKFIINAPEAVLPQFDDNVMALLDLEMSANILAQFMHQLDTLGSVRIAHSASIFSALVLKYWSQKDREKHKSFLVHLVDATRKPMEEDNSEYREEKVGLLLGSLLAGSIRYANSIKDRDQRRLVIINAVSNIVWAATTFIGIVPMAMPVSVGLAGSFSLAAVVSSIAANELGVPRDYCPDIKEIEGAIELISLECATKKDDDAKLDVLMTLSWMRAAIHVNGFVD